MGCHCYTPGGGVLTYVRYTGTCCPNGWFSTKKSQNMGPIFCPRILTMGQLFTRWCPGHVSPSLPYPLVTPLVIRAAKEPDKLTHTWGVLNFGLDRGVCPEGPKMGASRTDRHQILGLVKLIFLTKCCFQN